MSDPLLLTKLFIPPPRPKLVSRPHLIQKIDESLLCKLTLISAPAGFGKTTLVSDWVAGCGQAVAWLSLDVGDNDLSRFLTYLISALQTIAPNFGTGILSVIQYPQPPPIESILTELLNEIISIQDDFILVLDDYHIIDSKSVDKALIFLLDHLPPRMHLMITTREDPNLPLSRYRVRGQLIEIRAADLRFTPTESADFFNRVMGLNLTANDIAALESRTEGWIAGLQLAALSMQGRSDTTSFIHSFSGSHQFVLDYLVEEVLQRLPEHVRSFLLKTSILDRLNGSLCDSVTAQENSKEMLETLERSNLFIIPLDDQHQWYRYHPLFAEVLQARYTVEQPEQASNLHQRASKWFENNGSAAEAIHHSLAAKDFERAANLVELTIPEMRKNRQGAPVKELGWLKALPEELIRFRPVLSIAYAYALFGVGEVEAVEAWLKDAERWLDTTTELHTRPKSLSAGMVVVNEKEFRRLPGMITLLRTAQALNRGDMPETVRNARRVLDLALEDDYLLLGGAASTLGLAAWASGELDDARQMITEGMVNVRRAGYISAAIGNAITLADIQIAQGCLHEAMLTYQHAVQWAKAPSVPVFRGTADLYVGMSNLFHERNDLQTALKYLVTSKEMGDMAGFPQNPYRWCAAMARILETKGDLDGALDQLNQAERIYEANFSPNVRPIPARITRVWVVQQRMGEALGWVRDQRLSVEDDLSYLREFDHITLVRVLMALYQKDKADRYIQESMGLLRRLLKAAEERSGNGSVIEILVLQALAYHSKGNVPDALISLQRALALAEPQDYVRMFLDEGVPMLQLLREAFEREIMPDYTGRLLVAFEPKKLKNAVKSNQLSPQPLIEPLSERELEILRLLAKGLTNQVIAERLFLALDTIKGHNRNIFNKLQVQSRAEAVIRARELGLL